MDTMFNRMIKAAKLDVAFFNEAEADTSLNQEALMVIILVSVASGLGAFVSSLIGGQIGPAFLALFVTVLLGIVNYYIWSYVTYFVGTNLFKGTAEPGELLRVLGYASSPRLLGVLTFIPCLGGLLGLAGAVWALIAGFIGVREALDLDNGKTFVTVIIGWVIILIINLVIGGIIGAGALGVGAISSFMQQ